MQMQFFLRKFLTTTYTNFQDAACIYCFTTKLCNMFVFRSLCDSLVLHLPCLSEVRWSQRPQTLRSRTIRNSWKGHRLVLPSKSGMVIDQLFKVPFTYPPHEFVCPKPTFSFHFVTEAQLSNLCWMPNQSTKDFFRFQFPIVCLISWLRLTYPGSCRLLEIIKIVSMSPFHWLGWNFCRLLLASIIT